MRGLILTASVALACASLAQPVAAQLPIVFGPQAAYMTGLEEIAGQPSFNGTLGIGGRAAFQPPVLPIGVVGQGVYYFPEGDGSYTTYGLAAQLRLPLPMVSPYVIGGWQWRRASAGGVSATESGATVGAGVQLNLGLSVFLEGTMEFNEAPSATVDADNAIVIQGGVLFGG